MASRFETIEELKKQIVAQREQLLQTLELKYLYHVNRLMQQRYVIQQHIQKRYDRLIKDIDSLHFKDNINATNNANHVLMQQIWDLMISLNTDQPLPEYKVNEDTHVQQHDQLKREHKLNEDHIPILGDIQQPHDQLKREHNTDIEEHIASVMDMRASQSSQHQSQHGMEPHNTDIGRVSDDGLKHIASVMDMKEREQRKRLEERVIQRKYGHTQNGQFIDLNVMKQLTQMDVEQEVVIEALRQCNNNHQQTLNLCLDPQQKEILSQTLFARHLNDKYLYKIEQILSVLGADHVTESRVRAALFLSYKDVEEAIRMLSAPNPNDVVDLDRIEPRFVPYVQRRMMQMIQDNATDNHNDNANTNGDDDLKEDEAQESGDVVEPMQMETKAMPNPTLGDDDNDNQNEDDDADVEMNEPKLVEQFAPIAHKLPNDDDEKIEEHILNDLDNDEDSYLDVDLSNEQDAINNLKVLLNSIQASNPQASLSLFHQ
eukprot:588393_1